MSPIRFQELNMKLTDVDATERVPPQPGSGDVSTSAMTLASPGLRPEVLGDAAQRQARAAVHAALFGGADEAPRLGPYQLLNRLGEGAMGIVYGAYDAQLDRKVALKLIRGAATRDPNVRARTLREARALARVSHPNVVHVYQVGEVEAEIYVAMEHLDGPTLRAWLAEKPRFWREVLAVFLQAGDGLAAAHRQGVVHRDFKPANVILGADDRVRVLDFGLAYFDENGGEPRALPTTGGVNDVLVTQTGVLLGTPAYMAAEQFAGGRGDARTDQFSFCVALFEALHGRRPFTGDQLASLASAVMDGRIEPVATDREVPGWLHRAILRGLLADPAARWPSMDALLAALRPREAHRGWTAALIATSCAALVGGAYALHVMTAATPELAAEREAAAAARAETTRVHDENLLLAARTATMTDPTEGIRMLAGLAGDDPTTWQTASFLAAVAQAHGLPERVLRAGDHPLVEVLSLAGDGLIGRDQMGAVWRWDRRDRAGVQVPAIGAARLLLAARDVPVWVAIDSAAIHVFHAERTSTIALGTIDPVGCDWKLSPDGATLTAYEGSPRVLGMVDAAVTMWNLARPDVPPRTLVLATESGLAVADDASVIVGRGPGGLRVVRPDGESVLKYPGAPMRMWLSGDARFLVAQPGNTDGVLDIVDLATGRTRQVEAESVTMLAGAEVLFAETKWSRLHLRRESLATGAVAWRLPVPAGTPPFADHLVVDASGEWFAAAFGDTWGIGDLRRGWLSSFVAVPKGTSPRWAPGGALLVARREEIRVHRPAAASVQAHLHGRSCALAPGGRWAVVTPANDDDGVYTQVDLATREMTTFRCPSDPPRVDIPDGTKVIAIQSAIDDTGQVVLIGRGGWSCWWDKQHGARPGAGGEELGWPTTLPRGVAFAAGTDLTVWSSPDVRTQQWAAPGGVMNLVASPDGTRLAAFSERGVHAFEVETGAVTPVIVEVTSLGPREIQAGKLAWSPDGARLAVLRRDAGSLALTLWDLAGEPRMLAKHDLKDSPGQPFPVLAFTPSGSTLALTDRPGSLAWIPLDGGETRRINTPELYGLLPRSETDAIAIDKSGGLALVDLAAADVLTLAPSLELGFNMDPPMRRGANGSVWTCDAVGPGTLVEIAAPVQTSGDPRGSHLRVLAASL